MTGMGVVKKIKFELLTRTRNECELEWTILKRDTNKVFALSKSRSITRISGVSAFECINVQVLYFKWCWV